MFLHFGVNTFGNVEWSDDGIDARSYQPDEIDADGWVRTVRDAGMNQVILITKHHDGFCLWNTDYTDYCMKNSGNPTDVVAETAKACKKYGIRLGLYYSLWDRKEPSYKDNFMDGYMPYMLNQLPSPGGIPPKSQTFLLAAAHGAYQSEAPVPPRHKNLWTAPMRSYSLRGILPQ